MSAIDIIILIVFGVGVVTGFFKGAMRQIGSAAGVVLGFIGARLFGTATGIAIFGMPTEADPSMSPMMVKVMGCIVVYLAIWVAVYLVVRLVKGIISAVGLGFLDRLGGSAIMLMKLFLAVSIVLNVWRFVQPQSSVFEQSHLMDGRIFIYIMDFFPWLMGIAGFN